MLELSLSDIGKHDSGHEAGVRAWWQEVEGRKKSLFCLAWSTLILISPEYSWPELAMPEREEGWGEDTFRITYMKRLEKIMYRRAITVPALTPLLELRRVALPRILEQTGRYRVDSKLTLAALVASDTPGPRVYCYSRDLARAYKATGLRRKKADIRLSANMALLYKNGNLRAVLSTLAESALP